MYPCTRHIEIWTQTHVRTKYVFEFQHVFEFQRIIALLHWTQAVSLNKKSRKVMLVDLLIKIIIECPRWSHSLQLTSKISQKGNCHFWFDITYKSWTLHIHSQSKVATQKQKPKPIHKHARLTHPIVDPQN